MAFVRERFREYRHAGGGFRLPLPAEWETTEDIESCALAAVQRPDGSQDFLANVVVTVEPLPENTPLDAWVDQSREALTEASNRLVILDTEQTEIGGKKAWRTLSHYLHQGVRGVTLEQWAVAHEPWGYVVSCSTPALDYDEFADVMAHTAEGLRIDAGPVVNGKAGG